MSASTADTAIPSRVGSYDVVRPIAEGGMGAVYEVEHRVTKQRRALKVVRGELAKNADFRARFVREVTIASTVRHPNLVETQDPIEEGDLLALPMELLQGETLSSRLRRGPMSIAELLELVVPCCEAIHAVHERSVIHRDLKPLNVFLARDGERVVPKVLDFGAAREIDDDEHTRTGVAIGSPFYMAPEQAEGRKDLDRRVDVYAMGVITYVCLTGRKLYATNSAQSAIAKLLRAEKYPRPSELRADIPAGIEAAVMRALAYEREDRWPTLAAFADALRGGSTVGAAGDASEATVLHDVALHAAADARREEGPSGVRATGAAFAPPPAVTPQATPAARAGGTAWLPALGLAALAVVAAVWWIVSRPAVAPESAHDATAIVAPAPTSSAPPPVSAAAPSAPEAVAPAPITTVTDTTAQAAIVETPTATAPPTPTPAAIAAPAPAPTTAAPPAAPAPTTTTRTPRRPRSDHAETTDDAPCGLAVGIPCIE